MSTLAPPRPARRPPPSTPRQKAAPKKRPAARRPPPPKPPKRPTTFRLADPGRRLRIFLVAGALVLALFGGRLVQIQGVEGPAHINTLNFNLVSTLSDRQLNEAHVTYGYETRPRSAITAAPPLRPMAL